MNYQENIAFLKNQLDQTQKWLENEEEIRSSFVVTMIIKGMIDTEKQIEYFQDLANK